MSGQILDSTGLPLPSAKVYAFRTEPRPWTSRMQTASSRGRFILNGLHPGRYLLCAYAPHFAEFLNPCHWQTSSNVFSISADGRPTPPLTVRLDRGRQVSLEVDDVDSSLTSRGAVPRTLAAAVTSPLLRQPRVLRSRPVGGRTLSMTVFVPTGLGHAIEIQSAGLRVLDERLAPAPARIPFPEKGTFRQRLRISAAASVQ